MTSSSSFGANKEAVRRDAAYPQPAGSVLFAEQKARRIFPVSSHGQGLLPCGTYLHRNTAHPAEFYGKIPENDLSDVQVFRWSRTH